MTDNCDEEWREGEHWKKEKSKSSQGKDPKTFQENSQVKRWRVERKEVKWKKKKKMKNKKVKYSKRRWWEKCKESVVRMFTKRRKEDEKGKETEKEKKSRVGEGPTRLVRECSW